MTTPDLARDPQAFLQHLNDQLDILIRKSAALDAVVGTGSATDATGAVTVEFTTGGELGSISVAPTWEQQIKPEELATVITDTLVQARDGDGTPAEPVELSDEQVAEIRERQLEEMRQTFQVERTPEELEEIAESLPRSLDELNASFRELQANVEQYRVQISDEPVEVETTSVRSENGMVAIDVAGGVPVAVTIHQSWVAGRSGNVLTECFSEAIRELSTIVAAQPDQ